MREQPAAVEHAAIHRPQLQCPRTDDFSAGSSMTSTKQWDEAAQDALDRMHRAHGRGTGCHLTAEMIQSLALTAIGEIWSGERPTAPYPLRSTFELDFKEGRPRKKHGRRNISQRQTDGKTPGRLVPYPCFSWRPSRAFYRDVAGLSLILQLCGFPGTPDAQETQHLVWRGSLISQ
jgi:hypothetical protein